MQILEWALWSLNHHFPLLYCCIALIYAYIYLLSAPCTYPCVFTTINTYLTVSFFPNEPDLLIFYEQKL